MTKVHPNVGVTPSSSSKDVGGTDDQISPSSATDHGMLVLTVWKKSLLFNCNGFTVYDSKGNLAFRVDNYMTGSGSHGQILLMDASGKPLLTIRRKRLSLGDNWMVYDGESTAKPRFTVRKHVNILNAKCQLAQVSSQPPQQHGIKNIVYEIEGSYSHRCCVIYDHEKRRKVGEIMQKEGVGGVAFGVDVFRLVVHPEMDPSVAMAIVILLDQMFGSSRQRS